MISEQAWYKEWFNSPFYHKLYFDRDENEAGAFIKRLVNHLNPGHRERMLDVACGKGRHSRMLSSLGFDVTGIDISLESINYAKQFENNRLEFYQHDMRLPFRINYFNYVFNFFTSFGYFKTQREHDDAVRTMASCLLPGGRLVIDYLNVHYSEEHMVYSEEKAMNGTTFAIRRWHDDHHFYKRIVITDNQLKEPLEFTEKVAKFSLGDFNDMLSEQGLMVTEFFGDYALNPYDVRKTPRMIIIAQKALQRSEDEQKRLYSDGRKTDALT